MKSYLFEGKDLSDRELQDALEGENCGVEESHNFVKPFTENELVEAESKYLEAQKELFQLQKEMEALTAPLKEQIKPLEKMTKLQIKLIHQGGESVCEKVYCFPDYENKLMGLYDRRGILIGTRAMTRAERNQMHINSHLNKAV